MTSELTAKTRSTTQPLSLGRPRWANLLLAASLVAFWAGVILKIFS
jgi:hypothetical protein